VLSCHGKRFPRRRSLCRSVPGVAEKPLRPPERPRNAEFAKAFAVRKSSPQFACGRLAGFRWTVATV